MKFNIPDYLKYKMGIYAIINNITGKSYIGSAVSLKERFWLHDCLIRADRHDNSHLQRSYNKYGAENFSMELMELVKDKKDLIQREQFYIDLFEAANPELGYNLRPIANSNIGTKRTQDSKDKVSRTNGRKILKLDLDENIISIYDSLSIAANECGFAKKGIMGACSKENRTYKGFKWKFETLERKKSGGTSKGDKIPKDVVEKRIETGINNGRYKSIIHFNPNGELVGVYKSLHYAVEATGFKKDSIKNVCTGHKKSLFGNVFQYAK